LCLARTELSPAPVPLTVPRRDKLRAELRVSCREALIGCVHRLMGREWRGQCQEEATMSLYLLHDEYTPQDLAGGRS